MPKTPSTPLQKMNDFATEFQDLMATENKLMCKYCISALNVTRKSLVTQHLKTAGHQAKKLQFHRQPNPSIDEPSTSRAGQVSTMRESCSSSKFRTDLCQAMISENNPLNKLSNVIFRVSFLETYTGNSIPDQTTLRKYYVKNV